jgi:hypothetical protein
VRHRGRWAIVVAVGTLGLRDREAGTVTFTTSLGVGKKLDRIRAEPRVALAFHTHRHGQGSMSPMFVLVQGRARIVTDASRFLMDQIADGAARHLGITGLPRRGRRFSRAAEPHARAVAATGPIAVATG